MQKNKKKWRDTDGDKGSQPKTQRFVGERVKIAQIQMALERESESLCTLSHRRLCFKSPDLRRSPSRANLKTLSFSLCVNT